MKYLGGAQLKWGSCINSFLHIHKQNNYLLLGFPFKHSFSLEEKPSILSKPEVDENTLPKILDNSWKKCHHSHHQPSRIWGFIASSSGISVNFPLAPSPPLIKLMNMFLLDSWRMSDRAYSPSLITSSVQNMMALTTFSLPWRTGTVTAIIILIQIYLQWLRNNDKSIDIPRIVAKVQVNASFCRDKASNAGNSEIQIVIPTNNFCSFEFFLEKVRLADNGVPGQRV